MQLKVNFFFLHITIPCQLELGVGFEPMRIAIVSKICSTMLVLIIWCLTLRLTRSYFLFPQTCASSGENYLLHRKTSVGNCPTIGAAPCILTRNTAGLFHCHGPNSASYVSRVFLWVLRFSSLPKKHV